MLGNGRPIPPENTDLVKPGATGRETARAEGGGGGGGEGGERGGGGGGGGGGGVDLRLLAPKSRKQREEGDKTQQ